MLFIKINLKFFKKNSQPCLQEKQSLLNESEIAHSTQNRRYQAQQHYSLERRTFM
ncbi:MAG: hypothetical protein ACLFT0_00830 [Spirulinaceae cyanobacterium]